MNPLDYLAYFFAGALICNSIPHLAAGLRGEPFPSPFSKPRGVGPSPALVNFLWGTSNLIGGIALLSIGPFSLGCNLPSAVLAAGFLAIGVPMSRHFEKVRSR
jgi:hypothetical protein